MSSAIRTAQPPRRTKAASTKSWLRISAAEGRLARELGQAAAFGEGLGPHDGVVAPVVAGVAEPGAQAAGQHRAVDAAGELLHAAERRDAADELRRGLQDAELVVALHAQRQLDDAVGLHQAVGVEHEHEGVGRTPALDPVVDVAGLAAQVAAAVAVEDAVADHRVGAGGVDDRLLGDPDVGAGGVAEDEDVEGVAGAARLELAHHRAGGAEDAGGSSL